MTVGRPTSRRNTFCTDGPPRGLIRNQREKRKNQAPPTNPARHIYNKENNDDRQRPSGRPRTDRSHGMFDCESPADRDYASRVAQTAEGFDRRREENKRQFTRSFPRMHSLRREMAKANVERMQCAVYEAIENAKHDHTCCVLGLGQLSLERTRNVVCIGLGYRCVLTVENYRCSRSDCSKSITVHPLEVGCTPTSPTEYCETWIAMDFCLLFRDLQLHNGLSADGENTCQADCSSLLPWLISISFVLFLFFLQPLPTQCAIWRLTLILMARR